VTRTDAAGHPYTRPVGADRDEITDLLYTYAERIDAGDFGGVADLFADAEITFEGFSDVRPGRDEVLAMYEASTRRYDDGTPRTKHVMTNVIVDVDNASSSATARSYFTVLQAVPGQLDLQPIIAGRYRDTFARVDGAWRFRRRHMLVDLVGDLSRHMLGDRRDLS
jgi:ketosteroid isomerase-like protein